MENPRHDENKQNSNEKIASLSKLAYLARGALIGGFASLAEQLLLFPVGNIEGSLVSFTIGLLIGSISGLIGGMWKGKNACIITSLVCTLLVSPFAYFLFVLILFSISGIEEYY